MNNPIKYDFHFTKERNSEVNEKTIFLNEEKVKELFENFTNQGDVLIGIYKMVISDWDNIKELKGYPLINDKTWKTICQMFIEFDQKYHSSLSGGCWMNSGFSGESGIRAVLADWEVSLENCKIIPLAELETIS